MSETLTIPAQKMSTKWMLIIAGIILVLLILGGWYFYHKGKQTTSIAPLVKDTPGSNDPNNNPAGSSDTEIKRIANALHSDMNGVNPLGHATQPYEDLLMLSDTDFERVYNEFNTDYQLDSGETLLSWLDNEEVNLWDPSFGSMRDSIDSRMNKLQLK